MKKNIRKILGILMSLSIILLTFSNDSFAKETENVILSAPTDKSNEYYLSQAESIKAYNNILEGFSSTSHFTYDISISQPTYPDYYGGTYIDENTGELVILVTEMTQSVISELSSLSGNSSQLNYSLCDISYNEICNAINFLNNNLNNLKKLGIDIDMISDNIISGTVDVSVIDLNTKKEQIIKDFTGFDFLNLINSKGTKTTATNIGGGHTVTGNGTYSTLSFAAKRNGVNGFIVAGHHGSQTGISFAHNGITIGSVTATAYYNGTTADAAFVAANSNAIPTNTLVGGGSIWSASSNYVLPVSSLVYMYGQTSGLQAGRIKSTNTTIYYRNSYTNTDTYIYNQWLADYLSADGDSGGPVMCYDGNFGGQSKYTLFGIQSGRDGDTSYSIISPYKNIVNELNITCITG